MGGAAKGRNFSRTSSILDDSPKTCAIEGGRPRFKLGVYAMDGDDEEDAEDDDDDNLRNARFSSLEASGTLRGIELGASGMAESAARVDDEVRLGRWREEVDDVADDEYEAMDDRLSEPGRWGMSAAGRSGFPFTAGTFKLAERETLSGFR
jgi:hypothetical protein